MLTKPETFDALLSLWGSPSELSADLNIPYVAAQMMKRRQSIGSAHWEAVTAAAARKGVSINLEDIAKMKIRRDAENRKNGVAA